MVFAIHRVNHFIDEIGAIQGQQYNKKYVKICIFMYACIYAYTLVRIYVICFVGLCVFIISCVFVSYGAHVYMRSLGELNL